MSISSTKVKCGISRFAACMRSAMMRRTPMILISLTLVDGVLGAVIAVPVARAFRKRSKSLRTMRPPGPVPWTSARSTPASLARTRMAGEVMTLIGAASVGAASVGAASAANPSAFGPEGPPTDPPTIRPSSGVPSVSIVTSVAPTATTSPGSPASFTTVPLTGLESSTAALSVIIVPTTSSSLTWSPTLINHSPISDSTVPSPRSGSLKMYSLILPP